jgi:type IV pilus assembly protein PilB
MAQDSERIGSELIKRDVITREELDEARRKEAATGVPWYRQLLQGQKVGFGVLEDILHHEFHPKSKRDEHQNLGRSLLDIQAINEEQLESALVEQRRSGRLLGQILLDRGLVTRHIITVALSRQHGMEFAELAKTPSETSALDAVPESMARKNQMIPVRLEGDKLTVMVADPQAHEALRDVSVLLGLRIHSILTCVDNIREEIEKRYANAHRKSGPAAMAERIGKSIMPKQKTAETEEQSVQAADKKTTKGKKAVAKKIEAETEAINESLREKLNFDELRKEASGMPVIKLVQTIIEGAANSGATDIHIDPQEPETRVRYRIDGVLHDVMSIPPEIESAVNSRIKIMSDLDITETRHPQDGHISIEVGDMDFDIRVATLPCYLGERIVLRMLDQSSVLSGIKDLGMEKEDQQDFLKIIQEPYGMILVTGPTGSGKTTTLYAALNQKNVLEESIVTLEDPVEYQMSGINQVQIDTDIDVTFASTLRAALRQDIDVLLVGEIRDPDTARIAIRAAMTGHLVFSTLHTNDAPEAISTLRNMGVPSYLIASALTAVVAQRLVRTICPDCKTEFKPTAAMLQSVKLPASTKKLYRGKGCSSCYHTGNKGRTGIFEVLNIGPDIRRMIADDESTENISKAAKLKTMADRCRAKLKNGDVSPEEFLRVIRT